MKTLLMTLVVSSLVVAGGCNSDRTSTAVAEKDSPAATAEAPSQPAPASQEAAITPEQLGQLGAEIEKEPQRAKELLTRRGLDEKSFEAQIRKVTEDPEASKRYAEAYKKAKA